MFSKKKNNYYLLKIFFINYLLFIKLCLTLPTVKNIRQIAIPRIADHMINIGNLTRQHGGDVFDAYGKFTKRKKYYILFKWFMLLN